MNENYDPKAKKSAFHYIRRNIRDYRIVAFVIISILPGFCFGIRKLASQKEQFYRAHQFFQSEIKNTKYHAFKNSPNTFHVDKKFIEHLKTLGNIPKKMYTTFPYKHVTNSKNGIVLNGIQNQIKMNPDWSFQIFTRNEVEKYLKKYISASDWDIIRKKHDIYKIDLFRNLLM